MGPDCKLVKIGDHVIFSGWSGTQLDMDGEPTLIILNEDFIVAKIADTDEILMEMDGKCIPMYYSEIALYLAAAASKNKVETSTRDPKGSDKNDWKGST
jgi:predicted transglutaminase-like protease